LQQQDFIVTEAKVADGVATVYGLAELGRTYDGSATEYQVNTVDADGSSNKAIAVDCPDDAAAIEYAKQYIDGKDIELWQSNRKVAAFEHKPE